MPQPDFVPLQPFDEHNQALAANVHPADWVNPTPTAPYHLVVIGAGTAGLVAAAGAAGLGARVALIERELMGGDCLNVGCVPSKGILRAARIAATVRDSGKFGIDVTGEATVDFPAVMQRMRKLRARISPNDSASRFTEKGVDVFLGSGEFVDSHTVRVRSKDNQTTELKYRKAVIATGARAAAPPIPGLEKIHYLTNENLFSLTERPRRLGIIGSGPIGCEMAQAFARFGSEVVLFERGDRLLPKEDPQAAAVLRKHFEHDGVRMLFGSREMELSPTDDGGASIHVVRDGASEEHTVDRLLVAVGRAPNVDSLRLDAVGVQYDHQGVEVNDYLQTSNPRIYAAGDVCSKFKFTHAADFQARAVLQNALFAVGPFGKKKVSELVIPWATYTAPEVAHVGITAEQARESGTAIDTYVESFADVDRAILDGQDDGFVKIHTRQGTDEILGATIVAENAGDLICEISLAMTAGLGLGKISSAIHPYPTQAEAIRKIGDQYNRTRLTPTSKKLLDTLRWWNVGR